MPDAIENRLTERIGPAGASARGRSRNDRYSRPCACILRMRRARCTTERWPSRALEALAVRDARSSCRLHPHAAGDAEHGGLWALGFAAEYATTRRGCRWWSAAPPRTARLARATARRISTSTRGTRRTRVPHHHEPSPRAAVARKARRSCCRDHVLSRTSAARRDLLFFYTRNSLRRAAASFTPAHPSCAEAHPTCSSYARPQPVAQGASRGARDHAEALLGYHRDLQLIKPPLFRGIDSCVRRSISCERAPRRAVSAGSHSLDRHSRGRGSKRAGDQETFVPRGVPTRAAKLKNVLEDAR